MNIAQIKCGNQLKNGFEIWPGAKYIKKIKRTINLKHSNERDKNDDGQVDIVQYP